jgi:hypothetical protein
VQGLGKTLQSITFLAHLKWVMNVPGPHLVVVPLSVMSSWMSELARWVAVRVGRHSAVELSWVGAGSGSSEKGKWAAQCTCRGCILVVDVPAPHAVVVPLSVSWMSELARWVAVRVGGAWCSKAVGLRL